MADLVPLSVPDTIQLFAPLRAGLIALLRRLAPGDWTRSTIAGQWRVRDVVAHLLDGELRKLAAHRDAHVLSAERPPAGYADVLQLVQRLNAGGVQYGERLSPRLMTDLLEVTGDWMAAFVAQLDPDARAVFAVDWAGEAESTNLFDTAREFTERWHHEMQIRMAMGDAGDVDALFQPRYVGPLLDTAVRVLPRAYREHAATDGVAVVLEATSPTLAWTLRREAGAWRLYRGAIESPAARAHGNASAFCRLFFNALPRAVDPFMRDGRTELLEPLWRARSVMV